MSTLLSKVHAQLIYYTLPVFKNLMCLFVIFCILAFSYFKKLLRFGKSVVCGIPGELVSVIITVNECAESL